MSQPEPLPSLYQRLVAAGAPIDHHESDLYCLATPEARLIVKEGDHHKMARAFRSEIDGKVWIECPFAFDPWWEARSRR